MAFLPSTCLVCAPLAASTVREMVGHMQSAASAGADVLELRLDRLRSFDPSSDLPTLLHSCPLPSIITYRPKWGGGGFEGQEDARLDVLELAVKLGADYVDVELQVAEEFFARFNHGKPENCRIIVTSLNYERPLTTEDIGNRVADILSKRPDIVKVVTVASRITDVAAAFRILSYSQIPTIITVTGTRGLINQLLGPKYGGYLTVGSLGLDLDLDLESGHPKLSDLTNVYKIHRINRETKVFGVVSNPVGHSKGPILHNASFMEVGFDAIYVPFLVDDLAEFLAVYNSSDFAGFSIGLPYKEAAVNCCDYVDPLAQHIGAVNTIIRRNDGKLLGYNTDCNACISAIEEKLAGQEPATGKSPLHDRLFIVAGAGGAGRALAFGAKQKGARIIIANRNYRRGKLLANAVGGQAVLIESLNELSYEPGTILANATVVGMQPNVLNMLVTKECLKKCSLVFDAIYTPPVTRLIREAQELGVATVSGLEMFVRQAVAQFELFTGQKAPVNLKTLIRNLLHTSN